MATHSMALPQQSQLLQHLTTSFSSSDTFTQSSSSVRQEGLQSVVESEYQQYIQQHPEAHLYRLFVGWIPKTYTASQLQPLFDKYGVVRDIIVLKDKVTSQPRGCAFVSYATKQEAEVAIQNLDRQVHLEGALCPLEVRFAKSCQYIQAGDGPENNRQLFFSNAPTHLSEEEVAVFFSQFGIVQEVNLFRERRTQNSKGCGFITMHSRDQAIKAMDAIEEQANAAAESANPPLTVKWADPDLQAKKKKALEDSNADNRMLFFAKVLRSATEEEVKALFSQYGKVYDVNLFRAFQGAPTTKGCGLVTMGSHEEAVAAIMAFDNKFTWEGMESPMVVKWMDAALQRRRREQHLAAMRQGLVPSMAMGPDAWMPAGLALANIPTAARVNLGPSFLSGPELEATETPPAGCAPDAIKLFVGNIPKSCTEEQLMPFFETIGKVVELVIVRDKATHESKGSAFVWYATRALAERAILNFNLRHVLPDPTGEQDRPLVVRKAKSRNKGLHPAVGMLTQMQPQAQLVEYPMHIGPSHGQGQTLALNHAYYPKMQPGMVGAGLDGGMPAHMGQVQMQAQPGFAHLGYRSVQPMAGAQLVSIQSGPSDAGMYEAYGGGHQGPDQVEPYMQGSSSGQLEQLGQLAMSITLNQQQLAIVNTHLYSVQAMSGAQLNISPGAPGLFHLVIQGGKGQVEGARGLVTTVLAQAGM